jgi:type VI secretion system secreted protein VgrG
VPNSRQKVPYTLPANKTKSIFRTNTHKGQGFNELSFEDEKGRQEIYMHAQRDNRIHVENSRSKRIDNNQSESIGHNKNIEVGNNHDEVIGGNMTLMVGPNILQKGVTAAMQVLRSKMRDVMTDNLGKFTDLLGALSPQTMGEGNLVIGVGKNKAETVMVSSSEIVGAAKATTVGGGYQLTVGGVKNESVAMGSWEEVGQSKVTVVGHKYEIVCGKSRILMERNGTITIEGVKLLINKEELVKMKAGKIEMN